MGAHAYNQLKKVLKFAHLVSKSSNVNISLTESKNLCKASPFLYYHVFKEISPEYPAFAEYKYAFCPSCNNCYIYVCYFFFKQQKLSTIGFWVIVLSSHAKQTKVWG